MQTEVTFHKRQEPGVLVKDIPVGSIFVSMHNAGDVYVRTEKGAVCLRRKISPGAEYALHAFEAVRYRILGAVDIVER